MNLLTIEHLTKSYTERLLFNDTAFSINEGEKSGSHRYQRHRKIYLVTDRCRSGGAGWRYGCKRPQPVYPLSAQIPEFTLEIPFLTAL